MATKKILLLVLDGLGDREYEGKTPLESAVHPNFDELSATGVNGLMYTLAPGVVPGSDTAHLAMFGYDPYKSYSGRGAYEALGAGIELRKGDVAFRCNFATIDSSGRVVDRRAGRIEDTHPLEPLVQSIKLPGGAKLVFKSTAKHRAVLVLRGAGLSRMVSDVDSHGLGNIQKCMPLEKKGAKTANLVNMFVKKSHDVLKDAPLNAERRKRGLPEANVILLRGAGTLPAVESFQKRYGMKSACIAGGAMYKGVARALGMDIIDVKGATAGVDTNLEGKVKAAAAALDNNYDFVFLHIKGCDVMGHDGNFDGKTKFIDNVDRYIDHLMVRNDTVICVTGDHSTPCELKDHAADPVPLLIANCGRTDGVRMFGEKPCASGGLGTIRGTDLMPLLMGAANRARMFGT